MVGAATAAGNGLVANEHTALDCEEVITFGVDGAAVDLAEKGTAVVVLAAVGADRLVADKSAANPREAGTNLAVKGIIRIPDRPPFDEVGPDLAHGLVVEEGTVADGHDTGRAIGDGAADIRGLIVGKDIVGQADDATAVQDGTAPRGAAVCPALVSLAQAVSECQSVDGDAVAAVDIKDPVGIVATDREQARARSFDVHAIVDRDLVAGQSDGLAVEAGSEDDHVAALGPLDRVPERARSAV